MKIYLKKLELKYLEKIDILFSNKLDNNIKYPFLI